MTKDITAMGGYCIQVVVLLYLRCCPSRDRHTETQTERQAQAKPGRHDNQLHRGTCRWTMNTMANGWQKREKHCCGKKQCDAKTQTDRQTDRQTSGWRTGATGERAAAEGGYMGMGVANLLHQSSSIDGAGALFLWMVLLSCLCHISIFAHLSQLQYQEVIVNAHCEARPALWRHRNVIILRKTVFS